MSKTSKQTKSKMQGGLILEDPCVPPLTKLIIKVVPTIKNKRR